MGVRVWPGKWTNPTGEFRSSQDLNPRIRGNVASFVIRRYEDRVHELSDQSVPPLDAPPAIRVVNNKSTWFSDFARKAARISGQPVVCALAGGVIVVWLITGPLFGFSDTWQLVINTGTSVVTFLMVFLIQNTQDRDAEAMHIKLDELIRAMEGAHNALLNLENLTPKELDRIRSDYLRLAHEARENLQGESDDTPQQAFRAD
jgi:low affinity Fe/Cu permease